MIEVFNILNGFDRIDQNKLIQLRTTTETKAHKLKLFKLGQQVTPMQTRFFLTKSHQQLELCAICHKSKNYKLLQIWKVTIFGAKAFKGISLFTSHQYVNVSEQLTMHDTVARSISGDGN